MIVHLADIATNGELTSQSILDTDTVESPLSYTFRQLVANPGARLSMSKADPGDDEGPANIELLWRREEAEAAAAFIVEGRPALSVFITTAPYDPKRMPKALRNLQAAIVDRLRDTEYEPAFHLRDISVRPLAVLIGWWAPDGKMMRRLRRLTRVTLAAFAELDAVKAAVNDLEVD